MIVKCEVILKAWARCHYEVTEEDVDLLAVLITLNLDEKNIIFLKPGKGNNE